MIHEIKLSDAMMDLAAGNRCLIHMFHALNRTFFDGLLAEPMLIFNTRLRSSAGRFFPARKSKGIVVKPAKIEIAYYLTSKEDGAFLVFDTLAHEMIHYWLSARGKPCGHTPEFLKKMKQMGVSRYNRHPQNKNYKYLYRCPHCDSEFPARRRWKHLACARCCKQYAGGKYDSRFKLYLEREYNENHPVRTAS